MSVQSVSVVLVSHGGARWLPAVLAGIAGQTRRPDRVVAIDTGSKDDSAALLGAALGAGRVEVTTRAMSFPDAVQRGLDLLGPAPAGERAREWVWLLHDDSNPAPTALAALLAAAEARPEAEILGPKLREWPDLKRLLEVGVTISGTGRRETGLERGEYDQGQHDEVREVLAVNTAGMLVRRSVLEELGGFDRELPVFGNDLDFGWRAARAGHRTLVVPSAVVFHAEAAHRGVRRTPLTGRHTHYQERRAALYTLLANVPGRRLPWQVVRLLFGSLLRALGFLLLRSVGEALDEIAAVGVLARPRAVRAARRSRRGLADADPERVRALLAPWWLPYRHGLDLVGDLVSAASGHAQDVAERRRAAALVAQAPTGRRVAPVDGGLLDALDDEDDLAPDTGLAARFLTSPVALAVTAFLVAALVGSRAAWGRVAGGALSPAPDAASDWWRLYAESWHPLWLGTDVPAPAYVAPLALLGTVLGNSAPAAVSALLVLAVPLTCWGAWRFLRVVTNFADPAGGPRWLVALGAGTFALVPVVAGAWGAGRLGPVAVTALLPWLAHALLGFADPEADRRWRAAWRTGLLLALVAAFAPSVYVCAVLLTGVALLVAVGFARSLVTDGSISVPPLVALAVPVVVWLPWWLPLLVTGSAAGFLLDPGRLPPAEVDGLGLLLGRLDGGAPWWWSLPVVVLAVVALVLPRSRAAAVACWVVVAIASAVAVLVSGPVLDLPAALVRPSASGLIPVLHLALITAAVLALLALLRSASTRPAMVLAWSAAAVAALVPVAGAAWFVLQDGGDLRADPPSDIPAYMEQRSELGPQHGVLVVRGSVEGGLTYLIRRDDGTTLGEDEVLALTPEDEEFTAQVRTLVSRPTPDAVSDLARAGIEYVVLPAPVDGRVAAQLDSAVGLAQASTETPATRAWQVEEPVAAPGLESRQAGWRTALLVLQALLVLVLVVLCGPTWSREAR